MSTRPPPHTTPKQHDQAKIRNGVRMILDGLGEEPTREGLLETPDRVMRSLLELLSGRFIDPAQVLSKCFASDGYDEMVILRDIDFDSMCEHHMLPFRGTATVGYVPCRKVVGLSKLARLVDCYARRLQIQERMTKQISDALGEHLRPRGWGVVLKASHLCMCARGVRKAGASMITSSLGGVFKTDAKARSEFLRFARA